MHWSIGYTYIFHTNVYKAFPVNRLLWVLTISVLHPLMLSVLWLFLCTGHYFIISKFNAVTDKIKKSQMSWPHWRVRVLLLKHNLIQLWTFIFRTTSWYNDCCVWVFWGWLINVYLVYKADWFWPWESMDSDHRVSAKWINHFFMLIAKHYMHH